MGTNQTAEEIKKEQITKMGLELGSLYNLLYNETIWLHYKWVEYRELFGTKDSRIKLLNDTAPFFFFIIQRTLWENLILGIARITDPPKTFNKRNITIQAIPEFIEEQNLKEKLELKIKIIIEKTSFCRDWRNRRITHYDYELNINENAKPLEKASRELLKESLKLILEFINILHKHYFDSKLYLEKINSSRGAFALLHTLNDGLHEKQNYYDRLTSGNLKDYDINPKDI